MVLLGMDFLELTFVPLPPPIARLAVGSTKATKSPILEAAKIVNSTTAHTMRASRAGRIWPADSFVGSMRSAARAKATGATKIGAGLCLAIHEAVLGATRELKPRGCVKPA